MQEYIKIRGARENNLKNINLDIPRNKLVVFTGVSGSGKTTLAFDTIFAEGQRRYVESLSSYARQFLGQMKKPDVDSIEGLSPAISIDQKTTSHNPRSTVGTVTEIYDYLRLLFARTGTVFCPNCGNEITKQTTDQIVDKILEFGEGTKVVVKAPIVRGEKGSFTKVLQNLKKQGFVRVEINGSIYLLDEEIELNKNSKHYINVIVDRIVLEDEINKRLTDSIETAVKLSNGLVIIGKNEQENIKFNTSYSCGECGTSIEEISPRLFSFNSPFGACEECLGLGIKNEIDLDLLITHPENSLKEGVFNAWGFSDGSVSTMYFEALSKKYHFSLDTKYCDLPKEIQNIILYGSNESIDFKYATANFTRNYSGPFEGIIPMLLRRFKESTSSFSRDEILKLMKEKPCEACKGVRLNKVALSVKIGGLNIASLTAMCVSDIFDFFTNLKLTGEKRKISEPILKEIFARLNFLKNVGLDYLTLARNASTLSGGEAQRIRLATQIGSGLSGVLYILDEPSIGLHQRDNEKLLETLRKLKDLGNTLIVVEHDEDTILAADYVFDIGRKAGIHGGKIIAQGTSQDLINEPNSITGEYLSGKRKIEIPKARRALDKGYLTVTNITQNNLKDITVNLPAKVLTAVSGVSGSGKSSLVNEVLYPMLVNKLNRASVGEGKYGEVKGLELFDKVINIDQTPIGRTPRSNPATYTGVWNYIRELFASSPEAKQRGYGAGRFSFNVKGGRCEACSGDGVKKIEMYFLPDIYVECEECKGSRYSRETLEVKYKGKNIAEVLDMTIDEALTFFENIPAIKRKIECIKDVGLGYIKLGQSATTLSGGEAQRVKLATELSKRGTGKTIYILDEPTTGLHFYDVHKLINILQRLVNEGNTVLVIEHNLDVLKVADFVIDLGPEGGNKGGQIVVTGTPEEIAECKESYTGQFLKKIFEKEKATK